MVLNASIGNSTVRVLRNKEKITREKRRALVIEYIPPIKKFLQATDPTMSRKKNKSAVTTKTKVTR